MYKRKVYIGLISANTETTLWVKNFLEQQQQVDQWLDFFLQDYAIDLLIVLDIATLESYKDYKGVIRYWPLDQQQDKENFLIKKVNGLIGGLKIIN